MGIDKGVKMDLEPAGKGTEIPDNTKCYCEDPYCDWTGVLSDCSTEIDSEGWEYPEYEVLVCPKCGEYSVMF